MTAPAKDDARRAEAEKESDDPFGTSDSDSDSPPTPGGGGGRAFAAVFAAGALAHAGHARCEKVAFLSLIHI